MIESSAERIARDIEGLAEFTATPGMGMTRFSFSEEDRKTREFIKERMKEAGLTIFEDGAGNLFGRREGKQADAPAIMVGSHFDSVKNGGNFDGPAGVVMALEIARLLHENKVETELPIEFAALVEEEGGRFGGGLFGSRAMTGQVSPEELDSSRDRDGISLGEAMSRAGFDPGRLEEAVRPEGSLRAFMEMHIEQGPVLESEGIDLGIVRTIVGIHQKEVEILGRADHSGTTPMDMRKNALAAAAKAVLFLDEAARAAGAGTVGTVGKMEVYPGGTNIVPGRALFTVDIRSSEKEKLESLVTAFEKFLMKLGKEEGVEISMTEKLRVDPVKMSVKLCALFLAEAEKRGYSSKRMQSGAGHDAMMMASVAETGLVFVPSRGGRSHCPEEWTDCAQIKKGVDVVLGVLLTLAQGETE
ncbi:MAG: Zn-dependent hydrolase [Synergistaceae bacterium]|nr:Zn-dependent hydrolase [Synergistaceae bacterium]